MTWEAALAAGYAPELDLRALALQLEPGAKPQEEPTHGAAEPAASPEPDAPLTGDKHEADEIEADGDGSNAG
jgi:hypothetical protein